MPMRYPREFGDDVARVGARATFATWLPLDVNASRPDIVKPSAMKLHV